jgi:L-lactate dehydrogenase complex protein LldG
MSAGGIDQASAREAVLARVRAALHRSHAPLDASPRPHEARPAPLDSTAALARLRERLLEFGADVRDAAPGTVAEAIRDACVAHRAGTVVVPDDWPPEWTPRGLDVTADDGWVARELASCDAALTAARLGIAESGTVVFDGGPRQGRRLLTLLPEVHICVLRTSDVVDSIDAGMRRVTPSVGVARAITFVSGPSATTDIELTRIEGVHGPRQLSVILLHSRDETSSEA